MRIVASALIAFATTAVLLAFLRPLAGRIRLLAGDSGLEVHQGPVPLIGGLAMFCGFVLAAVTLEIGLTSYRPFFAAAAILVVVGILDDFKELSSRSRFAAQISAGLIMVYWGRTVLEDLGALRLDGSLFALGDWSVALTVFASVGVINALNMCDGLDGLAGGLALIALLGLLFIAAAAGLPGQVHVLGLLVVVVLAFLVFNMRFPGRPQALVFMGDAGSMFLGFAITWFFVDLSQVGSLFSADSQGSRAMAPVAALWLLVLPLYDTVWLIIWRLVQGRSPFQGGFDHLHHLFQMAGFGAVQSVWIMLAVAAALAVGGVAALGAGVSEHRMFHVFLGGFALYCVYMAWCWKYRRFLGRPVERRMMSLERRGVGERRQTERRSGMERRTGRERRGRDV